MPQTPHVERHFTGGEAVRDVVIGMSDGLTVPFALAAGLSGAVAAARIVVTAGLAEVAAGSIAMGLGGYLAARSDAEHYASELAREESEIVEMPEAEADEVRDILQSIVTFGDAERATRFLERSEFETNIKEMTSEQKAQFKEFLEKSLSFSMPNVVPYKKSYLFSISDHRALRAITLLYANCTLALERKLASARNIVDSFQLIGHSGYIRHEPNVTSVSSS